MLDSRHDILGRSKRWIDSQRRHALIYLSHNFMRFPKDIDIHRVLLRKNFFFELPVDVVFIVIILVLIQEPPTSNF